tara:strand:- start:1765 stop:1977 length:213 start_codon:yes stop_codon:yes gene_type:complete
MGFENINKNMDNLSKQLDELKDLQNQAFSQLDKESYDQVKEYHIDINDMMRKFKAGDYKAIDNYLKKYNK